MNENHPDLDAARRAVDTFVDQGRSEDPSGEPIPIGPGLRLLAELTGETPEAFRDDPRSALGAMGEVARELSRLAKVAATGDEAARADAQDRYARITDTLRAHGFSVPQAGSASEARPMPGPIPTKVPRPTPATEGRTDEAPTPGDVFRARLHGILSNAVERLETLHDEVLPEDPSRDDDESG